MKLSATYDELMALVREKSGQNIGIHYKDADTLTLSYDMALTIPLLGRSLSRTLSADLHVEEVALPHAVVRIDAGVAGAALDLASGQLLRKLPQGLVESFSGGRAVLNLDAVPKLKNLFEKVRVNGLQFDPDAISLDAELA